MFYLNIAHTCPSSYLLTKTQLPCSAFLIIAATYVMSKSKEYGILIAFLSCSCDHVASFMHLIGACCRLCRHTDPIHICPIVKRGRGTLYPQCKSLCLLLYTISNTAYCWIVTYKMKTMCFPLIGCTGHSYTITVCGE